MIRSQNLFALPAAEYVGKRNTTILSMATLLLSNIWAANVQSYGSLVGSRFIGGLAGGVIEALGPQIVAECFPNRHLGQAMVVYVGFLAAGSSLGPIAAGAIATRLHSWRWFFNISAIAVGLNLLSSLLMFPETTYPLQQHIDGVTSLAAADSSSNTLDHLELRTLRPKTPSPIPRSTSSPALVDATTAAADDAASIELHTPLHPPHPPLLRTWLTRSLFLTVSHGADRPPRRGILSFLRSAAPLLVTPPVLVTTLLFGLTIGWTVVASIVVSAQYSAPPWLFDAERVGFLNWGPLVGLLVGIPVGGAVADVLYGALAARKKGGVNGGGNSDPRHRLPAVLPGAVVSPAGWLVMGFALRDGWAWGATSAGWGMAAFGLTASANVMLTYVVDCFPGKAGEIGVLVNGMKNFFAFGVSYGSLAWYESAGAMGQFATMAGLSWAVYAVVPVLYFWRNKRSDLEW
ncbi:putative transporter mfc1 [Lasiodiplodia theobromae]|uniref:Putative transporter mfc1 n=1 Tax=Lasiodiplodia theobromae TaxID=45133 RepID=A0A5N5DF48_9PEZI|nr:putative transporter mfc1 [Lasiodiplodia theobromae]